MPLICSQVPREFIPHQMPLSQYLESQMCYTLRHRRKLLPFIPTAVAVLAATVVMLMVTVYVEFIWNFHLIAVSVLICENVRCGVHMQNTTSLYLIFGFCENSVCVKL